MCNNWNNWPTERPPKQQTKQSTNQPSNHPTNHPTYQPTNQPTSQPTSQQTTHPSNQPHSADTGITQQLLKKFSALWQNPNFHQKKTVTSQGRLLQSRTSYFLKIKFNINISSALMMIIIVHNNSAIWTPLEKRKYSFVWMQPFLTLM